MRYADVKFNDLVNTDGVALSVWLQGCSKKCKGCFSKQTWDFNGGFEYTKEIESNIIYCLKHYDYDYLCLIGGDPLENIYESKYLINLCKHYNPNIKVWVYSGYTFEEILKNKDTSMLLNDCNVLVDGRFVQELYNAKLKWRGSSNQNIYRKDKNIWIKDY